MSRVATLEVQQAQAELARERRDEAIRQSQARAAVETAWKMNEGDIEATQETLKRTNPYAYESFTDWIDKRRKTAAETQLKQVETLQKTYGFLAQGAEAVSDDISYQAWLGSVKQLAPQLVQYMPPQYNEAAMATIRQQGMTLDQQFKERADDLKRYDQLLETNKAAPVMAQDWLDFAINTNRLKRVTNEEERKAAVAELKEAGVPARVLALLPSVYTDQWGEQIAALGTKKTGNQPTVGSFGWYQGLSPAEQKTALEQREAWSKASSAATADQAESVEQIAQAIANNPYGLASLRTIASMRGGNRERIYARVMQLNPDFDPGVVDRRAAFVQTYESPSGRAAINRQSMNNILLHSLELEETNKKYARTNARFLNTAVNEIKSQSSEAYTEYMTMLNILREEVALYFSGGYAPKEEAMDGWAKAIGDGTATPNQMRAFEARMAKAAFDRADTWNSDFRSVMGFDDPNLITPKAREAGIALGYGKEVEKYKSGGTLAEAIAEANRAYRERKAGKQPTTPQGATAKTGGGTPSAAAGTAGGRKPGLYTIDKSEVEAAKREGFVVRPDKRSKDPNKIVVEWK
jgi:hypothetical protein